ncbi:MAG: FHA domain-containing protein [Candidatus Eisenbacteria bacterium]
MLQLTVIHPERQATQATFFGDAVTLGRASDNQLHLDDEAVSSHHGRLERRGRHLIYTDVGSTNGSIVYRDGKALAITGRQVRGQIISDGDRLKIGPFTIMVESNDPLLGTHSPEVLETQAVNSSTVEESATLRGLDLRQGERILAMVLDAQATLGSLDRLCQCVREHLFRFFPDASHLSIVMRDQITGSLKVAFHDGRETARSEFRISHTIVRRVMREAVGVLLLDASRSLQESQSIVLGGIETAICAPLRNADGTFGAIQLDVRDRRDATFSSVDLRMLVTLADFVSLLLDNHRHYESSRRGLRVSVEQLLLERQAACPGDVSLARRVSTLATAMGRVLRLSAPEQELLQIACLLTAWSAQDRPALVLPDAFLEAPFIASCRDEQMDGNGPLGLTGDLLSPAARILALATAVAMASDAPNAPRTEAILGELEKARGTSWDPACLDALRVLVGEIDQLLDWSNHDMAA